MRPFFRSTASAAIWTVLPCVLASVAAMGRPSAAAESPQAAPAMFGFMPHGMCYLWNPGLLFLHAISDGLIAAAYFGIAGFLFYSVRRRKDIPLRLALGMFGAFIIACATTHVFEILTIWHPLYWLSGAAKAVTATVSVATAIVLVPLIPKILTFRSPADLERLNLGLESSYRRLLDTAQEGVWTVDCDARITFVNRKLVEILGYAPSEIIGRSSFDFAPVQERAWERERFEGLNGATDLPHDRGLLHRDGTTISTRCSSSPIFDESGGRVGELGMFVDLSARRRIEAELVRSQERHISVAEAIPQMVYTATTAGEIDYYSSRWQTYTGIPTELMLGWGWTQIIHPDDLKESAKAWSEAVAAGTPFEWEHRFRRADGTYRWHLGRALPLRDETGSIVQWFGTSTDVDDQRRTLEAQERLTEQLEAIVAATDQLSNSLDPRESLKLLCASIVPRFADWMAVNLIEDDGRIRNVALEHADPAKERFATELRDGYYVDPGAPGIIARVVSSQRAVVSNAFAAEFDDLKPILPDKREAVFALGLNSIISVPMLVRGNVIGVLSAVWSQSDKRYSDAEVPFFEELAKRAAVAFDDAARDGAARTSEEIARRIMQSSEDCIAILSLEGRLLTVNDRGVERFGAAGTALAPGSDWIACWRPEYRVSASAALAAARAGSTGKYQARSCSSEASQWWDVVVTPITDVTDTPLQLLAVSRDITLQKDHESALHAVATRYRAFANAIPAIAFTATANGTLDFVNDRWTEYTGLTHAASLEFGLTTVTHPIQRATLTAEWFAAVASGRAHETETRLQRSSDGVYRWHLMRVVPIRDVAGRIVQWFGTGTDIDDQKRAEAAIAEARDIALKAATAKSQFVATMSHEIRTPISGVIGMTELLLITALDDEQRQYANVVRESGQSLLRVINDILDYSKLDAGKLQLDPVDFRVATQIKSVVDLLRAQLDAKRIALTSHIDSDVPTDVVGDAGRLRQILLNLMGNAVKFTPSGGQIHVAVGRISASDESRDNLRFEIKDSGVGIAPDVQTRLFEAFSQGDGSTTRVYGGTGLGLSICKQLVSLMRGRIGVESTLGAGAAFWFSVEFARSERSNRASGDASQGSWERRALPRKRNERILLVEDNQINTLLAQRQFEQLGFGITTVSNGREALEAIASAQFDLIFMDCHMPEMDGFEATHRIRILEQGGPEHRPIVAMTADAQVEDRTACLAAGMDDYLSKPSSIAQLRTVVERWLPAESETV